MIKYAFWFLLLLASYSFALPKGMSFIGLKDGGWQGYIVNEDGRPSALVKTHDIRQLSWSPATNRAVYIDSAGKLVEQDTQTGVEKLLVSAEYVHAYTQVRLSDQGLALWAIELVNRQSQQTRLVRYDNRLKHFEKWHQQPGAIFDVTPQSNGLLYTYVSCIVGCEGIRQELWQRTDAGYAEQLTRFNAIVRYPAMAPGGDIWYSLNQGDAYHLWFQGKEGKPIQLTSESASDLWVSFDSGDKETAYFIRRDEDGGRLMKWTSGEAVEIPLDNILDIRDLEITE